MAREALPEILADQGASAVEVVPSYKTVMPKGARTERMRRLVQRRRDRSGGLHQLEHGDQLLRDRGRGAAWVKAGAIGPITAETARTLGFEVAVSPSEYTIDALVAAITDYFAKRGK